MPAPDADDAGPPLPAAGRFLPPERLEDRHDLFAFQNGKHASLDDWLLTRARGCERLSARTYVVCAADARNRVVGYYAISAATAQRIALPDAKPRRGLPGQVRLLRLGRLAVDRAFQGPGLGTDLLAHALRRCLAVSEIVAARGIVAHALDDDAVRFYERHGFLLSPLGTRVMLMPMETARALFAA